MNDDLTKALDHWEQHILNKLDPKKADQEFGVARAHFTSIGERVARRLFAANQSKCSKCGKPLPHSGPYDTIPRPAPDLMAGWVNQFACSAKCAELLRQAQHDREVTKQANG